MEHGGERLGNYIVEAELERAATEVLWRARHQVLPRRAVIKVRPDARNILHEACILESMQHPGVVRVYETGLLADRRAWFARELVAGPTLGSTLAPGAVDRVDAVALLRDLAEVLEHAHGRGVVHGRLRPRLIVLTGRVRGYPVAIKDWSEARAHDAPSTLYLDDGDTPYASPEQQRGDAIDDRTDVYALGVIAYQLLTGTLPRTPHVPTEVHCPDAPRELTQLVDQMLEADHWDRPSSGEACDELELVGELLAAAAEPGGMVRIRRPRWTPPIEVAARGTRDLPPVSRDRDDKLRH